MFLNNAACLICTLIVQNALSVGTNSVGTVLFYIASSEMSNANLHPFIETSRISHKQKYLKIHVEILEPNPVFQVQ